MSTSKAARTAFWRSLARRRTHRGKRGDVVLIMHPQVRARYIAALYAARKDMPVEDRPAFINKQESRVIARSKSFSRAKGAARKP